MYANICIMRLPERKENEREAERFFEKIMASGFPNLIKCMNTQIQETQQIKAS